MSEVKPRCELELFVEDYFGLSESVSENHIIKVDYGQIVNLLAVYRDKVCSSREEKAFVAGRSKTSWEQFKIDSTCH